MAPRYTEDQARAAVAASMSYAEALRRLGMCDRGGSWKILRKWIEIWGIPVDHFDPHARSAILGRARSTPLDEVLVEGRPFKSAHLKERLYREGVKHRRCELCGQGEIWHGKRMALILDHINGVRDDNRLENLRIVWVEERGWEATGRKYGVSGNAIRKWMRFYERTEAA